MKEFSGLDAAGFDNRPLKMRKEIVHSPFTVDSIFDTSAFTREDGSLDAEALSVERYALASFLIEAMWKNLQTQSETFTTHAAARIPITADFWKLFADHYIAVIQEQKDVLYKKAETSVQESEADIDFVELATMRYMYIIKLQTGETGLPSFIDFISIYTRLARVVDELGGESVSREHYEQALSHPSFRNMMLEMMMNSRDAGMFQLSALEGNHAMPDTDDTTRKFDSTLFTPSGRVEDGDYHIEPDPEIAARLKSYLNELFRKKQADGVAPSVFRCPVIYTGIFNEMCEWMRHEFSHHYIEQRFGQEEGSSSE